MADENIKLKLGVEGGKQVDDLREKLTEVNQDMGELVAAFGRGEIELRDFDQQSKILSRSASELTRSLDKLEQAGNRAKGGIAGLGNSARETGRVVQDFAQGGFGGVINNLEGLATAVGGGPGLAGALTILGTAFLVFKPQINEFLASFQTKPIEEFQGRIEELEAKIKGLTEKPFKLSADFKAIEIAKEQLDELQKGLAAAEKAGQGKTTNEKKAGAGFQQEFAEAGQAGRDAWDDVKRMMVAGVESDPAVKQQRAAIADREKQITAAQQLRDRAMSNPASSPGYLAKVTRDAEAIADPNEMRKLRSNLDTALKSAKERALAEAGNDFDAVVAGDNPIARGVLAERFRSVGQDRFAAMVERNNPERVQADEDARKAAKFQENVDKRNAVQRAARLKNNQGTLDAAGDLFGKITAFDTNERTKQDAQSAELIAQYEAPALGDKALEDQQAAKKAAPRKAEARATEDMAKYVYNNSNYTADQSRAVAARSMDILKSMGNMISPMEAMQMANNEMLATMQDILMKQQAQAAGFQNQAQQARAMRVQGGHARNGW